MDPLQSSTTGENDLADDVLCLPVPDGFSEDLNPESQLKSNVSEERFLDLQMSKFNNKPSFSTESPEDISGNAVPDGLSEDLNPESQLKSNVSEERFLDLQMSKFNNKPSFSIEPPEDISGNANKRKDKIDGNKMFDMIKKLHSKTELDNEDVLLRNDLASKVLNANYYQIDELFSHLLLTNLKNRRKCFQLGLSRESQADEFIDKYPSRFVQEFDNIVKLGKGGFGVVYKAKNKTDGCWYAIKKICPSKEGDKDINSEVNALATLKHDNIVRYYFAWQEYQKSTLSTDSEEDESCTESENSRRQVEEKLSLYIVMEYCEKRTLKEWLSENIKDRDISNALAKFEQITSALQYIHGNRIMHRDLTPANIFLSHDDKIKIGDFGLVTVLRPMLDNDKHFQDYSKDIGTWPYQAPELKGGSYSEKVDIYSLGVILLELIHPMVTIYELIETLPSVSTGTFPKTDDTRLQKMYDVVKCLLSEDPEKRPSAKDILERVVFQKIF